MFEFMSKLIAAPKYCFELTDCNQEGIAGGIVQLVNCIPDSELASGMNAYECTTNDDCWVEGEACHRAELKMGGSIMNEAMICFEKKLCGTSVAQQVGDGNTKLLASYNYVCDGSLPTPKPVSNDKTTADSTTTLP